MPSIVFDIVGTLISYQNTINEVEKQLGEKFKKDGINTQLFYFFWVAGAERDYSYLSQSKNYQPFLKVMEATFFRSLYFAGIQDPRSYCTQEQVNLIVQNGVYGLTARAETKEALRLLREYGFKTYCLTDAAKHRVLGYFKNSDIEMPEENVLSCDSIGQGKPEPVVYQTISAKLDEEDPDDKWFFAAHMWDSSAAKHGNFRTAWSDVHELEPCTEIFGEPDVIGTGLIDTVNKVIAKHKELKAAK